MITFLKFFGLIIKQKPTPQLNVFNISSSLIPWLFNQWNILRGLILNKSISEKKIKDQLLFENLSESFFLIPELKKVEYLLKIEGGGFNIQNLLRKLNELDSIISCYRAKITATKSKYNLIFEWWSLTKPK